MPRTKIEFVMPSDPTSLKKIENAIDEIVNSKIRASAEKDLQKEIKDRLKDEVGIPVVLMNKLAKLKYEEDGRDKLEEETEEVVTMYDKVFGD